MTSTRRQDGCTCQVFVSGTWNAAKAEPYRGQARLLGERLAQAGLDLACGPGTGIARHVIDGYRAVEPRGAVRYYLPLRAEMEAVGETVEDGADEIIETPHDYPMRNVWQVKQSQGVFALTGGDGTLEELLPGLIDYGIPVAVIAGAGSAATAMRALLEIWPEWGTLLMFGSSVDEVVDDFIQRVIERAPAPSAP